MISVQFIRLFNNQKPVSHLRDILHNLGSIYYKKLKSFFLIYNFNEEKIILFLYYFENFQPVLI
jgi:hypothetical protein